MPKGDVKLANQDNEQEHVPLKDSKEGVVSFKIITDLLCCLETTFEKSQFLIQLVLENHFHKKLHPVGSTVRDDEAVYWVSIGHYEAVVVGN